MVEQIFNKVHRVLKNHYFLNNSQKLTDFDNLSRQNPEEFDTSHYAFVHLACKK